MYTIIGINLGSINYQHSVIIEHISNNVFAVSLRKLVDYFVYFIKMQLPSNPLEGAGTEVEEE